MHSCMHCLQRALLGRRFDDGRHREPHVKVQCRQGAVRYLHRLSKMSNKAPPDVLKALDMGLHHLNYSLSPPALRRFPRVALTSVENASLSSPAPLTIPPICCSGRLTSALYPAMGRAYLGREGADLHEVLVRHEQIRKGHLQRPGVCLLQDTAKGLVQPPLRVVHRYNDGDRWQPASCKKGGMGDGEDGGPQGAHTRIRGSDKGRKGLKLCLPQAVPSWQRLHEVTPWRCGRVGAGGKKGDMSTPSVVCRHYLLQVDAVRLLYTLSACCTTLSNMPRDHIMQWGRRELCRLSSRVKRAMKISPRDDFAFVKIPKASMRKWY